MTEAQLSPSVNDQLAAISSLNDLLDRHGIDHWLFGGWAVDFWAGTITRKHDDIDVAAWRDDYDKIKSALEGGGWRHAPAPTDAVGTRYTWRSAEVEFTFIKAAQNGNIVIPLEDPVVWSAEPLGEARRDLLDVSGRVIPLKVLREGKSFPREGAAEGAKDRADLAALSGVEG